MAYNGFSRGRSSGKASKSSYRHGKTDKRVKRSVADAAGYGSKSSSGRSPWRGGYRT